MEYGPDAELVTAKSVISSSTLSLKNGVIEMANFPTTETTTPPKVNGESIQLQPVATTEDTVEEGGDKSSNSDCDNLVIDESERPAKRRKISLQTIGDDKLQQKKVPQQQLQQIHLLQQKSNEPYTHSNPYFDTSIFDLTKHYNTSQVDGIPKLSLRKVGNRYAKRVRGKNGKPQLREYAQYLGLQPSVQFKCSRCGLSGYESLQLLNEHFPTCTAVAPSPKPETVSNNTTNFKVIRKVFLCSACGTYYENWNLFLHMREVHKRLICLYCLGMFPHAEKLSAHLVQRHGCMPIRHADDKSFFAAHKEPCFIMCSDCQMVFTEQDYVTKHRCTGEEARVPLENGQDVQVTTNKLVIESSATKDGELSLTGTVEVTNNEPVDEREYLQQTGVELRKLIDSDSYRGDNVHEENHTKSTSDLDNTIQTEENEEEGDTHEEQEVGDEEESNHEEDDENEEQAEAASYHSSTADERKVPKVTLKLTKLSAFEADGPEDAGVVAHAENRLSDEECRSDDSEKLTMEVKKSENREANKDTASGRVSQEAEPTDIVGNDTEETQSQEHKDQDNKQQSESTCAEMYDDHQKCKEEDAIIPAGNDVSINEIELEQPLDKIDIKLLLQKCLQATITTCLYCNHARRISVNGKQLGLHAIAEHRFAAIVKSITAEELIPESFNNKIKDCFDQLSSMFFSLDDPMNDDQKPFLFECFQCRYSSTVQKDLYQHNRKLHANALLLCTMCKTSFYSYSELLCHLCPGIYCEIDVKFKCFICINEDIPSAFRLVVHLRKKHNMCDVCLETSHSQTKLSNHVWKHKQAHLCYRCGIAYRNKQDINRHLFWKHGTESVECKRCLTKKWPHVYHFCTPPASFPCNECDLAFSRASRLRVHKRLHTNEFPHSCSEEGCTEKLISKRLLAKHEAKHREPLEEIKEQEVEIEVQDSIPDDVKEMVIDNKPEENQLKDEDKPKPKVDVYDLPELNLSESDSSESEDESTKSNKTKPDTEPISSLLVNTDELILETSQDDILKLPDDFEGNIDFMPKVDNELSPVLDNTVLDIWNNFKSYQENIAKTILTDVGKEIDDFPDILTDIPPVLTLEQALRDHDYCLRTSDILTENDTIHNIPPPALEGNIETSADHDYCTAQVSTEPPALKEDMVKNTQQIPKQASTRNSSSDSDSSSCTCGSNCSCSSSSGSSSSSSDSSESDSSSEEGRRKQQVRREKRRGRPPKVEKSGSNSQTAKVKDEKRTADKMQSLTVKESPIRESDLDTTELETDEEFYDKEPQKIANKIIAEKREKLQLAAQGTHVNGNTMDSRSTTPTTIPEEPKKKKSKSKKKKKKKSSRREARQDRIPIQPTFHPTVAPLTLSIPKHSQSLTPMYNSPMLNNHVIMGVTHTPLVQTPPTADDNSGTRASKRRRVPNKFYGYSSDEETEKTIVTTPNFKFRKMDLPSPKPVLIVPPLTIKTSNITPVVPPTTIRLPGKPNDMRVQPFRLPLKQQRTPRTPKPKPKRLPPLKIPPIILNPPPVARSPSQDSDSDSGSSTSDADEEMPRPAPAAHPVPIPNKPSLYCYCRCPYDEVSEMIGCDSDECAIEWFHFECVNIMVAPKGQWFCPECRKKNQERREMMQQQQAQVN